jgi:hypothetical protein
MINGWSEGNGDDLDVNFAFGLLLPLSNVSTDAIVDAIKSM